MSSPLISVAVSTRAAERHIRGCLEMLLRQTVADRLEIIVIDSGSPELERTIVDALQRQHHNIVYLRTPRETLYAAWNRALSMSSGKYFANVNTDDWIRDDALEIFALATTGTAQQAPGAEDVVAYHPAYEPAMPLFYGYGGSTQFWRRSSLVDLGGFEASFVACGDLDVLCRLILAGGNAVLVPQVLEGFFQNQDGISRASDVSLREQGEIFAKARAETPLDSRRIRVPRHPHIEGHVAQRGPPGGHGLWERALAVVPDHLAATHNRYVALAATGRADEAERDLATLTAARSALVRGQGFALMRPAVEPRVRSPEFDDCDGIGAHASSAERSRRVPERPPDQACGEGCRTNSSNIAAASPIHCSRSARSSSPVPSASPNSRTGRPRRRRQDAARPACRRPERRVVGCVVGKGVCEGRVSDR